MERRIFIKNLGAVSILTGILGGGIVLNSSEIQIKYPVSFSSFEKNHLSSLAKEMYRNMGKKYHTKKWIKSLLEPIQILSQKQSLNSYETRFVNQANQIVSISKQKEKCTTKFLGNFQSA